MKVVTYGLGGHDATKPNGNVIADFELPDPPAQPLSEVGALATLLAVERVVSVGDAANAVGLTPGDLVTEAEAWAVAAQLD